MFRHNLLLIYRNFQRFRGTFSINLIGLSTGLTCTLFIWLWVNDELNVDKFHRLDSQLYKIMANHHNQTIDTGDGTTGLLADALMKEIPGIESAVRTSSGTAAFTLINGNTHVKATGICASREYFTTFSFPLLQGNANLALADDYSIVISETTARKLFGTISNVVGKSIDWQIQGRKTTMTVSAIMQDLPANSSERFDFLIPFNFYEKEFVKPYDIWSNNYSITTLVLKEGTNVSDLDARIRDFMKTRDKGSNITLFLQKYSDRYLHGKYVNGVPSGGRITYVRLFSVIAVFILLIACINFMNLSTARASRRIKEVGIKKAVGAQRRSLVLSYLSESTAMSFVSLLVAVLLVDLLLPQFNIITGKHLHLFLTPSLLLVLGGITLVTGIIAGSYPAFYLSGFRPASVLKGKLSMSFGEVWARKGLVVFQFTLSVILITAVLVVYKQIEFVQTQNLGFDKDNVIYFEKEGRVAEQTDAFLNEVKRIRGVVAVSSTTLRMGGWGYTEGVQWEGKKPDDNVKFEEVSATYDALELLGMKMKEGRTFSRDFASDSAAIIFNEAAIAAMGLKDPVGKTVDHYDGKRKIIGVVKDFHFQSMYNPIGPLFFKFEPKNTFNILVKIEAGRERETLQRLEELYRSFNPGFTFNYTFMNDDYQALYIAEKRVSLLSEYFAAFAILISCLGLFGLASFTAERRRKEIGIRKTLGATEAGIIYLLSGDFTKIVAVAIAIALPISYLITRTWLDSFAFRIPLELWYFAGAGTVALLVAWLTVSTQAIRASRVNPAQCLKEE